MLNYIISRLLQGALVIFLISLATFVIMRMLPGDPVMLLLGEGEIQITQEQIDAIRAKWGLDRPYYEQYLVWAGNMLRGDFGDSLIRRGVPVRDMIFEAMPVTGKLNLLAFAFALVIALPAGVIAAVRRNSLFDYGLTIGATAGVALPNFWFGLMGIIVFSLLLRWLPPFGLNSWQGYILPVVVLASGEMAIFARVMRSATIEVLGQDYVRTATAKGLAFAQLDRSLLLGRWSAAAGAWERLRQARPDALEITAVNPAAQQLQHTLLDVDGAAVVERHPADRRRRARPRLGEQARVVDRVRGVAKPRVDVAATHCIEHTTHPVLDHAHRARRGAKPQVRARVVHHPLVGQHSAHPLAA